MAPHEQLRAWIAKRSLANAEVARRLSYDRGNFHRILEGVSAPSMSLAHRIEVLTDGDIAMSAWVESQSRRPADVGQAAA